MSFQSSAGPPDVAPSALTSDNWGHYNDIPPPDNSIVTLVGPYKQEYLKDQLLFEKESRALAKVIDAVRYLGYRCPDVEVPHDYNRPAEFDRQIPLLPQVAYLIERFTSVDIIGIVDKEGKTRGEIIYRGDRNSFTWIMVRCDIKLARKFRPLHNKGCYLGLHAFRHSCDDITEEAYMTNRLGRNMRLIVQTGSTTADDFQIMFLVRTNSNVFAKALFEFGFVGTETGSPHLCYIEVASNYRNQGIGSCLLDMCEDFFVHSFAYIGDDYADAALQISAEGVRATDQTNEHIEEWFTTRGFEGAPGSERVKYLEEKVKRYRLKITQKLESRGW